MNTQYIGQRIKKIREEKKWTQTQLSKELDVSITHLSLVESGKKSPSLNLVLKIADILEVDPGDLISVKDEGFINKYQKISEIFKDHDLFSKIKDLEESLKNINGS